MFEINIQNIRTNWEKWKFWV